tara:strand:+ start:142 stop:672 length:531 start_codon:yes stop_codon:yes gene_type:complete
MVKTKAKKAQIMGQIFIYIMAAIIFSLVLLYGYTAISDFINRADQVAEIELRTDLKASIKSTASSQDVKQKVISIPSKFKEICFIDLDIQNHHGITAEQTAMCDSTSPDFNALICNFWTTGAQNNVFLIPGAEVSIDVGNIDLDTKGFLCVKTSEGKAKLRLEGKGDRTKISEWPS